ncbi:MAG TPA: hypothetical protein VEQ59_14215, partial [Polyangiaceae bacterium]|nr:hypothetical protein [Polyangiaceae bacterium]
RLPAMRLATNRNLLSIFGLLALSSVLTGCPEKGGPADKTTAEPERAEPDDEGKAKAPVAAPAVTPPEKKADDEKDKGGW